MTSDNFKKLRASAGYTQASLAKEMGVHLRTVTRWEIGEVIIPRVVEAGLALLHIAAHAERAQDAQDLKQVRASLKEVKRKGTVAWKKIKKESR